MEFVALAEVAPTLRSRGLVVADDGASGLVAFGPTKSPVEMRIGPGSRGEHGVDAPAGRIAEVLEVVLHKLRLAPLHLVPASPWRNVFDLLRAPLAEHERWMTIDSEAIVEQNTRDPLVVDPRDLHLLRDMVAALLAQSDVADELHAVAIVAQGPPLVAHILPGSGPRSGVRLLMPTADLARQACDAANHFLLGRST